MGSVPGGTCAAERRVEQHAATNCHFEYAERLLEEILESTDTYKRRANHDGSWILPARRYSL